MILEVGKTYKNNRGDSILIIYIIENPLMKECTAAGILTYLGTKTETLIEYAVDGTWNRGHKIEQNLVLKASE